MRKEILLVGGLGFGAGLMYVFDPARGRRRRAMLRERATHAIHSARVTLDKKSRDFSNRARGVVAEAGAALRCDAVTDDVLVERVRSQLGRAVSKPDDVEVLADEGRVTLRGVARMNEVERLLRRVSGVRGVRDVECQLNVKGRRGRKREIVGENGNGDVNHSPERPSLRARLLATLAGGGLALYGARRRGVVGSVAGFVGLRMLKRGLVRIEEPADG